LGTSPSKKKGFGCVEVRPAEYFRYDSLRGAHLPKRVLERGGGGGARNI